MWELAVDGSQGKGSGARIGWAEMEGSCTRTRDVVAVGEEMLKERLG